MASMHPVTTLIAILTAHRRRWGAVHVAADRRKAYGVATPRLGRYRGEGMRREPHKVTHEVA